jgi:tetratricopeptide (TPR) repeat protein
VAVALDVIARGERGTNHDEFVNAVLAQVAEKTRRGDLEGGASTIDQGLAELDAAYRRSWVALLEEGVKVDILRRDPVAVARRIEMLVATEHPTDRPTWLPKFRQRYDAFREEGEAKGINFSLSVAIELARRMLATAQDSIERGDAAVLLGIALWNLGQRESGTERLEQAVQAYQLALQENTRERVPLDWAMTQMNLGTALRPLGERESGTERLEQAVQAYQLALQENTRERVPLLWAMTIGNQGTALALVAEQRNDLATSKQALSQITTAFEVFKEAGHAPYATYYGGRLRNTQIIVERLHQQ